MAPQAKPARLIKSYAMPVDAAAFAGVPSVTVLVPMPSRNVLLAAAMDRRVVCCDLAANGPKRILAKHLAWEHENWVHTLDVHPDGMHVATGGADRRIKFWEWGHDKPIAELRAHDDWVRAVAFSPDGRLLASAGDDRLVRLWDVEKTVTLVATLDPRGSYLDTLAWSPDGKRLFSAGRDGKIHVWIVDSATLARGTDVDNRRNIEDEPLNGGFSYPGGIRRLACSPDGKRVAAGGLTSLVILDLESGKQTLNHPGRTFGVAFEPSGRRLAFSPEKDLHVWDFQAGGVTFAIPVDQLGQFGICFLDGGRTLASGGCNGWVGLWDVAV